MFFIRFCSFELLLLSLVLSNLITLEQRFPTGGNSPQEGILVLIKGQYDDEITRIINMLIYF